MLNKQIKQLAFCNKRFTTQFELKEKFRPILMKEGYFEDEHFIYYLDRDERIRKVPREYEKRKGVYRLRMLEPFYRWWIRKSPDVQNAIIPIFLSFIFGGVIYNGANFIIEREEAIMEKARVDPSFTEENLKQWKAQKQNTRN